MIYCGLPVLDIREIHDVARGFSSERVLMSQSPEGYVGYVGSLVIIDSLVSSCKCLPVLYGWGSVYFGALKVADFRG